MKINHFMYDIVLGSFEKISLVRKKKMSNLKKGWEMTISILL